MGNDMSLGQKYTITQDATKAAMFTTCAGANSAGVSYMNHGGKANSTKAVHAYDHKGNDCNIVAVYRQKKNSFALKFVGYLCDISHD